jgi:putative ABC transport system permease protein
MYPGLLPPLLVGLAISLVFLLFLVLFRPVLRRLAMRQVRRRPFEALLVIAGALLGTALIVASLTVGDSFDRSVRQVAYDVLGPVDEYVRTSDPGMAQAVAQRLAPIAHKPNLDGVLVMRDEPATAVAGAGAAMRAEPRTIVWETDYGQAADFGGHHRSGLVIATPRPGTVVVNSNLASSLQVRTGDTVRFYLFGQPYPLTVTGVVKSEGLAGFGLGASKNQDAFVAPGTLEAAGTASSQQPTTTVVVSNSGGVLSGSRLTSPVKAEMAQALGSLTTEGAVISTPKQETLASANSTGDLLGSLFLFIASFSIIAGVMLVVLIVVMLAEERRGELGMLRAIGMRRRRVTGAFAIEGAFYAAIAAILGAGLGVLIGRAVVFVAMAIINSFSAADARLTMTFAVRPVSIANGIAAGFLVAFLAVVLTSVRIARTNIIAAIRDLEPKATIRSRRRLRVVSAASVIVFGVLSVPAVANGVGPMTYLMPAMAALASVPLLSEIVPRRAAMTGVALATLLWGLFAHVIRPHIYDTATTGTYVVMGSILSFSAVVLVSLHQDVVVWPLRRLVNRPTEAGLAARLAIAYPTAKRFRTGATLGMYSLVVLVIVLMTQIKAVIDVGVNQAVHDATGGWVLRVDSNPGTPVTQGELAHGQFAADVTTAAPLVIAPGFGTDPLNRHKDLLPITAIGIPADLNRTAPALQSRLPSLPSDQATWQLVQSDNHYVLVDAYYGASGGPQGKAIRPGEHVTVTGSMGTHSYTVAGVIKSGLSFYGVGGGETRFPILMAPYETWSLFGDEVRTGSWLVALKAGTNAPEVAQRMQAALLSNGVIATDLSAQVRDNFTANRRLFLLMQGYLALGLTVGICGLGVVMIRAVRERRRTIGVLRALGFQSRTVQRALMAESALIAGEGVLIGAVLGVVTTWLLFRYSPAFGSNNTTFPISWLEITVIVLATLLISLLVTFAPARRAAKIRPAVAVRVAD